MDNLSIYNKVRVVPKEAQKTITGGRLNGMTDINPMWRIKTLTEQFGVSGIGWYTEMVERWTEPGVEGEMVAWVRINLYVKVDGEWSKPIEGIGGAMAIAKEKSGLRTDDEAFKKAYTDACSVACKHLGIGADVYWNKDNTKYTSTSSAEPKQDKPRMYSLKDIETIIEGTDMTIERVKTWAGTKFGKDLEQLEQNELYALCVKLKTQLGKD